MMVKEFSFMRAGSKTAVLLPIMALLTLTFCSKEREYKLENPQTTYTDVELHLDAKRNEELGKPIDTHYTSSGEPFTGTQKTYYSDTDSLYMEMHFEDGINTKSIFYMKNGDINRLIHGRYLGFTYAKEIYVNGNLSYENVPPTESKDGVGYLRTWHRNGQLGSEVTYKGDRIYQGLMTEYDEEGNIIKQERYEDDELVETIK